MRLRSQARRMAMQYLYQMDLTKGDCETPETFLRGQSSDESIRRFALSLVLGVHERLDPLNEMLRRTAQNYALERIGAVERNILRLGAGEMLMKSTPPKVIIDEMVELAKQFGGKDSGSFVNGILDRLMRECGTTPDAPAPDATA